METHRYLSLFRSVRCWLTDWTCFMTFCGAYLSPSNTHSIQCHPSCAGVSILVLLHLKPGI